MGCLSSRIEKKEALLLCKARKRFVKQMVDRRYALAAAQVGYLHSLRDVGVALRRFAEAQVLIDSTLSVPATETTEALAFVDKSPSHSSYLSPSPSHNAETSDSPLNHQSPTSPVFISPRSNLSYMKSGVNAPLTLTHRADRLDSVKLKSPFNGSVEDSTFSSPPTSPSLTFPPPPPFPEMGTSWDFFDPVGSEENFLFNGENGYSRRFGDSVGLRQVGEENGVPYMGARMNEKVGSDKGKDGFIERSRVEPDSEQRFHESPGVLGIGIAHRNRATITTANSFNGFPSERSVNGEGFSQTDKALIGEERRLESSYILNSPEEILATNLLEQGSSKRGVDKEACTEREDASEFITHRAKDFLSSIKDIEHRFFRASESGKEVSRMLEGKKNLPTRTATKRRSPASILLSACSLVCCTDQTALVPPEPSSLVTKVITWNRSASSQSSSSRNPLATASKDDVDDSGSDFVEDFCMISGSHSSTLDRLYAWERKLYDEVKASEYIRKEYDKKCIQLRQQFARDLKPQVIDKTRAIVKDLHSQIMVAIHAVESISHRIEKLRDEELLPQLIELLQGLIRMWRAMLECHHKQYITISLAYHAGSSTNSTPGDSHRQIAIHLKNEIDCFGSSFSNWISAHVSYIEALNGWLQNCILPPQERSSRKKNVFCPRRALAPPIFVLCPDWLAGVKALPAQELSDAIKDFSSDLQASLDQHEEERKQNKKTGNRTNNGEPENRVEANCEKSPERSQRSDLSRLQPSLTRVFDRLTKFSEASLKMYEDVRQGSENANLAYANGRTRMGL